MVVLVVSVVEISESFSFLYSMPTFQYKNVFPFSKKNEVLHWGLLHDLNFYIFCISPSINAYHFLMLQLICFTWKYVVCTQYTHLDWKICLTLFPWGFNSQRSTTVQNFGTVCQTLLSSFQKNVMLFFW